MTLIIILIKYKGVIYKALELEKRVRVRAGERDRLDKRGARERGRKLTHIVGHVVWVAMPSIRYEELGGAAYVI